MALLHIINGAFPLWAPNTSTTNYVYVENAGQTITKDVIYTETNSGIAPDPQNWDIPDVTSASPTPNMVIYNGQEGYPTKDNITKISRQITTDGGPVDCITSCDIMIGTALLTTKTWDSRTTTVSRVLRVYLEFIPQSTTTSYGSTIAVKVNVHLEYCNHAIDEYWDEHGTRHTYISGESDPYDIIVNTGGPLTLVSPALNGSGIRRLNNNMYVCLLSMSETIS